MGAPPLCKRFWKPSCSTSRPVLCWVWCHVDNNASGSRLQPLRGDPDNPPPEGTNAHTPQARPREKNFHCRFSLRGDACPAVFSLLLQCQANSCTNGSHKQLPCSGIHWSQLTNSWRCPPHGGPGPPHRALTTTTCDSCQQPNRAGIRPLTCATPDCPRLIHSARRCSGLSAREGRWLCRQHRQKTISRKQSLVGRSFRYNNKSRTTQHADPVGTATATSPAISIHLPAAAATLRSIAPVQD